MYLQRIMLIMHLFMLVKLYHLLAQNLNLFGFFREYLIIFNRNFISLLFVFIGEHQRYQNQYLMN